MGCGVNSKVLPAQIDKSTQNKTAENTQPNSKNKHYTTSIKDNNNNNNQDHSDQDESDAVGRLSQKQNTRIMKASTLRHSGSLSLSILKQSGTAVSQQQQIIQPKLNKQHSISVRKIAGGGGHRASIELSELLGKSIPGLGNTHGTQNNINDGNESNFQDTNVVAVERKQRKDLAVNNRLNAKDEEVATEQYVKIDKKPTAEEIQFVIDSLSNNSVFYSLAEEQVAEVLKQMFLCSTKKGSYLFRQGDKASAFFVIKSGKIGIEIDGSEKKELSVGIGIGELALLYSAPRSASVKCKTDCLFWVIDRKTFRKTVEEIVQRDSMTNRKFMESVQFFSFMNNEQKDSIAAALISVRFKPGDIIVAEGDRADSFYLIKQGKVSVWKDNTLLRNLYQNDSFGEQALYAQSTRAASVKADEEVKLLSLGRDDLTRILGGKIQKIVYQNKQRWTYNNCPLLLKLTKIQIEKLLMNTKISSYKAGTILYEPGDYCDQLIAVIEGNIISGGSVSELIADRGQIFGDRYLPGANQNIKLDTQVVVGSDAVLSIISFKQFNKCIGGEIMAVIKKNANSHEVQMKQEKKRVDYSDMKLEDLIYIKKLGEGQFGSVYLVRRKYTKELYALKSVSKAQIIQQSLEKHLLSEKNVLQLIDFPFIMPLIRTFKDEQSVYFLLKFISGMELFDVIRDIGLLSTFDAQFYTSSLILSLEYLHSKQIIYRDIKPENLMVDHTGYLYLIDMGAAKLLNQNNSKQIARTFTIIGTPHYMAPEIIKGKGYTYSADLWSVGICLYEFMCGMVPYAEEASDPYEIYEEINNQPLKFPGFLKDRKAKLFMEQLLQKQPELRLGGSYAALKTNPWFDSFEWDGLYNKAIDPPFIPPAEKLITQEFIDAKFKENKQTIQKIKQEQEISKIKYNKAMAKDPEWDKEF